MLTSNASTSLIHTRLRKLLERAARAQLRLVDPSKDKHLRKLETQPCKFSNCKHSKMSGLEVVGLALGAISVVITWLEHYGEFAKFVRSMKNYPGEFPDMVRRLALENELFKITLEITLKGCVDDATLTKLVSNTADKEWADAALGRSLQRKLDQSFEVFVDMVTSMHNALDGFKARLKLSPDGKVESLCSLIAETQEP